MVSTADSSALVRGWLSGTICPVAQAESAPWCIRGWAQRLQPCLWTCLVHELALEPLGHSLGTPGKNVLQNHPWTREPLWKSRLLAEKLQDTTGENNYKFGHSKQGKSKSVFTLPPLPKAVQDHGLDISSVPMTSPTSEQVSMPLASPLSRMLPQRLISLSSILKH